MVDFSHIGTGSKTRKRARYIFHDIQGSPWIEVMRADESNKNYFNAMLRAQRQNRRRLRRGNVSVEDLQRMRETDVKLFPLHVCKDWGNVLDANGVEVPFSAEACEQFLRRLLEADGGIDIIDDLRDFAASPESFSEDEYDDGEDLAKN